jgi:HSP20 family protein
MDQNKNKDQNQNPDFDLFGLTNLFNGLNELLDLAENIEKKDPLNNTDKIHLDPLENGMKGVYGFTINPVLGGKPKVKTFGNIKKTPNGPKVDEEREPLTEILEQKDEIIIFSEIPGVEDNDIIIELKENILKFSAANNSRKYRKKILLSHKVQKQSFSHTYKNGILEIKIKK